MSTTARPAVASRPSIPQRIAAARAAELRSTATIESAAAAADAIRAELADRKTERRRVLADGATARVLAAFDRVTADRERDLEVASEALRAAHRVGEGARREREALELERRTLAARLQSLRDALRQDVWNQARAERELAEAQQVLDLTERRVRRYAESRVAAEAEIVRMERELAP